MATFLNTKRTVKISVSRHAAEYFLMNFKVFERWFNTSKSV